MSWSINSGTKSAQKGLLQQLEKAKSGCYVTDAAEKALFNATVDKLQHLIETMPVSSDPAYVFVATFSAGGYGVGKDTCVTNLSFLTEYVRIA